ncbi:phage gp46-like protein [Paraburkholderia sp. BL8N3]|nr:phage GP46 family protein [Paraburkholderia sp. BL8N3]TCK36735.1 phage gp46-like protein [Paraburkholderia sp. BL8N3]
MLVKTYVADGYWVEGYTATVVVRDLQEGRQGGAMTDASISWDAVNRRGDWTLNGSVLSTDEPLQTAIIISLFSDRMARPGDVIPDGSNDPRGWWADSFGVPVGSRMWLLSRAKESQDTLQRAFDYLAEALQWMIDDGVVGQFDIVVQWVRPGVLGAQITAHKQDGTQLTTGRYAWAWSEVR